MAACRLGVALPGSPAQSSRRSPGSYGSLASCLRRRYSRPRGGGPGAAGAGVRRVRRCRGLQRPCSGGWEEPLCGGSCESVSARRADTPLTGGGFRRESGQPTCCLDLPTSRYVHVLRRPWNFVGSGRFITLLLQIVRQGAGVHVPGLLPRRCKSAVVCPRPVSCFCH